MPSEQPSVPEKRVRLSGEERRLSILRSAKRVFARSTYAGASTSELARECEVTEPMLYKHFGSKKGLFLAVLETFSPLLLETLRESIARRSSGDISDALMHVVSDYLAAITAHPETPRILFQAVAEARDPDIARCVNRHKRAVYEVIRELVARARSLGALDAEIDLDAATSGYMSMILAHQYDLMLKDGSSLLDEGRVQDEVSRIWLRGLQASGS